MINLNFEQLADQYYKEGNWFEAEKLYLRILSSNKQNVNAMYKLAYINIGKLNYAASEMLLENALKVYPGLDILKLLAYVKEKLFKFYDALVMYEKVLELEPTAELFEIVCNLYIILELYDNAILSTKEYVEKFPTIIAYRRLFLLYFNLSKNDELQKLLEEIKEKFPNKGLMFNLVGLYKEFIEKDYSEAEKLYEKAVKLGVPTASYDMALCLKKTKKYDEAEKYCKKVLDTYPRKNDILELLKEIYFIQKKVHKGYKYYLQRTLNKDLAGLRNKWNGKDYPNKTLLVIYDTKNNEGIMNLRFLSRLKNKFKNIILACPQEIEGLAKFNKIKTQDINNISDIKYDFYTFLSELQYDLNISFENIPNPDGYLKAQKAEIEGNNFKVGLLWKAPGDTYRIIQQQAIDLKKYLKELFDIEGVEYYSFQKNDIFNTLESFPQIKDLSSELNTLEDCAKYINAMDLIISVDSDILHLAGALKKKAIGLIPYDSEWYWFDNQSKTEWYNSIELEKQSIEGDWSSVTKNVVEKVKKYNAKHKKTK